jgi:GT2 family glycosyltransferase
MLSPRLLNPDGTLQPSTYSFPSPIRAFLSVSGLRQLIPFAPLFTWLAQYLGKGDGKSRFWAHDRTIDVDTFRGACVLGRMKAIREVGPMVTVTRAGGEEVEWHLRLRRHGWRVVFYHEVGVVHYGSQTINTTVAIQNEYLKGFLYFFKQHHTKRELYTFGFLALVALWLRCAKHLWSGQKENAQIDLEGINLIRTSL